MIKVRIYFSGADIFFNFATILMLVHALHLRNNHIIEFQMKRFYILVLLALFFAAPSVVAKNKKDVVYLFGLSYSYSDSVVYFTEIQPIEGIELKKKMLPERQHYAYELKDYMHFSEGMPGRISVIYFAKKRKKLEKLEAKVKKKILHKDNRSVLYLGDKFRFTTPQN